MKPKQISILSLLLVMALAAAAVCLVIEKRKSAEAILKVESFKRQVGHIEIGDASRVFIRDLHCESADCWQYRIFLPKDHDMVLVIEMGESQNPKFYKIEDSLPEGQFTLTIDETVDLLKPNDTPFQIFTVGCVGDSTNPDSIKRYGTRWPESESKKYRNSLGHYENAAHNTSLRHSENVDSFTIENEISLLKIQAPSNQTSTAENPESIRISIMPRSKVSPPEHKL